MPDPLLPSVRVGAARSEGPGVALADALGATPVGRAVAALDDAAALRAGAVPVALEAEPASPPQAEPQCRRATTSAARDRRS